MLNEANLYLKIYKNLNFSQKKHDKSLKIAEVTLVLYKENTIF